MLPSLAVGYTGYTVLQHAPHQACPFIQGSKGKQNRTTEVIVDWFHCSLDRDRRNLQQVVLIPREHWRYSNISLAAAVAVQVRMQPLGKTRGVSPDANARSGFTTLSLALKGGAS